MTTFRTSKGTIVNVAAPSVYVSPAFISAEDVTNPSEMREALRSVPASYLPAVSLKAAEEWLFHAEHPVNGGIRIAFDRDTLAWETNEHFETTGYLIPTLYRLGQVEHNNFWGQIATRAANRLQNQQQGDGSWIEIGGTRKYTFNTAMAMWGVLEGYFKTGTAALRTSAVNAANFLLTRQQANGSVVEVYPGNPVAAYPSYLCYLWYRLYKLTGTVGYATAAANYATWILTQIATNKFVNNIGPWASYHPGAESHFIAYSIHGLLLYGLERNDATILNAAKNVASAVLAIQRDDGAFYEAYNTDWTPVNTDRVCLVAVLQMGLNFALIYHFYEDPDYLEGAKKALNYVVKYQDFGSLNPGLFGGVPTPRPEDNSASYPLKYLIDLVLELYPEVDKVRIPVKTEDKVFDALQIRDTNHHYSSVNEYGISKVVDLGSKTVVIRNGLDQDVTIQIQGDRVKDFGNVYNVGSSFPVPATSVDYRTVEFEHWILRVDAVCGIAPTSGSLTAYLEKA
jgi:hypothetical protein